MHTLKKEAGSTREYILSAVAELFYSGGTYAVGVDAIVEHLDIARATFYRHFKGKEDLIVAYLERRDAAVQASLNGIAAGKAASPAILEVFDSLQQKTSAEAFRGCSLLAATIENPSSLRIREAARNHKLFLKSFFFELLRKDFPEADILSDQVCILYEGVLAAAVLRPESNPAQTAKLSISTLLEAGHGREDRAPIR